MDDEKLAHILSYVNQAWGNKERLVTEEEVAKARKSLPISVYTPKTLLKQFPFDKKLSRKNGTFTPTYDDLITTIIRPIVYRTFMPGASPAAFAVALPVTIIFAGMQASADCAMFGQKEVSFGPISHIGPVMGNQLLNSMAPLLPGSNLFASK